MGYMGFGMRKEAYTRKPKTPYRQIKAIYGKHGEKLQNKQQTKRKPLSESDKRYLDKVRKRVERQLFFERLLNWASLVIIISIVLLAIYFLFTSPGMR